MIDVEAVRKIRIHRKLTVSELAVRMGSHRPDVSAWVNGRQPMKLDTAIRLADALDCKVDDLIVHN